MEPLQEGGAVQGAAIRCLEDLVLVCRRDHRGKLRTIPPLPNWIKELEALNEVRGCGRGGWARMHSVAQHRTAGPRVMLTPRSPPPPRRPTDAGR